MENDKIYLDRFHGQFLDNENDQLPSTSSDNNNFCSSFLMVNDDERNDTNDILSNSIGNVHLNDAVVTEPNEENNINSNLSLSTNNVTTNFDSNDKKIDEKNDENKGFVENVVSYLTNQNENFKQNFGNEEEKNKKYLYRLITYLLKGNPIARAIFDDAEINDLSSIDVTKFTRIIMNANNIINLDSSSKYQLTLVYKSLTGIINSIIKEIPEFNSIWQSLSTTFHSQYEMCLKKDYQICQLHYLANCGNLDDPVGDGDKVTTLSRTQDFLQQMLVPISLSFSQFTIKILLNIYKEYKNPLKNINKSNVLSSNITGNDTSDVLIADDKGNKKDYTDNINKKEIITTSNKINSSVSRANINKKLKISNDKK